MNEISKRLTFHFAACITLTIVWSYFISEWWAPVVGVLVVLFGIIPVVLNFIGMGEPYRTETVNTTEEARKLIEEGFEYVCTHKETMIFKRPKHTE
jgi:hypothetical protein